MSLYSSRHSGPAPFPERELELTSVRPAHEVNGVGLRGACYLVTANRPLWDGINGEPTDDAFALERGLTALPDENQTPYVVCTRVNAPVKTRYEMWIEQPEHGSYEPVPHIDEIELNERIHRSPRPDVKFARSQEHPGLLLVHRSAAFGNLLTRAIRALPTLQSAEVIPTGRHEGTGLYQAYPKGVLLGAVLRPSEQSFELAQTQIDKLARL